MKIQDLLTEVKKPIKVHPSPQLTTAQKMVGRIVTPGTDDTPITIQDKQLSLQRLLNAHKKMKNVVTDISNQPEHKYVGAGVNAYVHRKDTPHDMDAVYRTSKNTDTTALYLEYIYNHPEIQNNPFFPKIIQSETGTSGIVTHIVERLVPFDTKIIY